MSRESLDEKFRAADQNGLPDVRQLDERHRVFWVLRLAQEKLDITVMTPAEISNVLRDVYGILVSRQKVEAILSRERKTVAKRRKSNARAYQLMGAGSEELDAASDQVMFVEPAKGFSGLRETHALLASLTGELRVCDPYVDERTLDMLAAASNASAIRLLTFSVKTTAGLRPEPRDRHGGTVTGRSPGARRQPILSAQPSQGVVCALAKFRPSESPAIAGLSGFRSLRAFRRLQVILGVPSERHRHVISINAATHGTEA